MPPYILKFAIITHMAVSNSKKIKAVVFDYGGVIFKNLYWHNDMFHLARDLRAKGYKTAILSNMLRPIALVAKALPTTKEFSPIVISADVGTSKPRPEIYKILLDRIKLNPEECLFIDDRPENLKTADSLGIQTLRVRRPKTAVLEIRELLGV